MELVEHIGIFDNAVPAELCKETIDWFEAEDKLNLTYDRPDKSMRDDRSMDTTPFVRQIIVNKYAPEVIAKTMTLFWVCYKEYSEKYHPLQRSPRHVVTEVKWQRTSPQQGYHEWHYENSAYEVAHRIATFILYLNDIEDGGETEFLYQSFRVKPKTGRLVIWPAAYTHTHRGNPPLKDTKYVMTGWLHFVNT